MDLSTTVHMEFNRKNNTIKFFGMEALGFDSIGKYIA